MEKDNELDDSIGRWLDWQAAQDAKREVWLWRIVFAGAYVFSLYAIFHSYTR